MSNRLWSTVCSIQGDPLLRTILNRKQSQLLKDEKAALERLQLALAGFEVTLEDQKTLQKSIQQLDELFLLVVVGEFNSGKSAFINALLGERFLEEGVTPTTAQICILHHDESASREVAEDGVLTMGYPAAFLREINIVDTPGTNAIIRRHEQLTQEFVPRSDLVIFITSADRPFTESERAFMERIREWGKKVVILLNKTDLLEEDDIIRVTEFIRQNALALLGFTPEIFPVSARLALKAKQVDTPGERDALWAASSFQAGRDLYTQDAGRKEPGETQAAESPGCGRAAGDELPGAGAEPAGAAERGSEGHRQYRGPARDLSRRHAE